MPSSLGFFSPIYSRAALLDSHYCYKISPARFWSSGCLIGKNGGDGDEKGAESALPRRQSPKKKKKREEEEEEKEKASTQEKRDPLSPLLPSFPPTAHPFPRPPLPRCRCPSFPNPTTRIRRAMCHLSLRVVVVVVLLLLLLLPLLVGRGGEGIQCRRALPRRPPKRAASCAS